KKYRFTGSVKSGTSSDQTFVMGIGTAGISGAGGYSGDERRGVTGTSSSSWVEYSFEFVAGADSEGADGMDRYDHLWLEKGSNHTGTMLFDSISVIPIGAVAEYEPDGIDIANTTWHDSSGNDLDGTINGATIVGQTKLNEYAFGSNQDSTSTILAGNLTGTIDGETVATVKSGAAAGLTANQDDTATILGGNHTGTIALTATVDSVAMSAIKAGAALGNTASQDSRGYLNFGDGTSTAYNSVSPQPFDVEMHTLNGVLNGDGYAMPRAGRVTGMSVYCDNTISGTDSSVTFYVTDNGSKTASYVMFEKSSDFKVGEDLAYADDFSHAFSAGDRIGCIMTIDDAGGGAIGKIAISIEVVT
ncbi:MAG: hypothetical protein QF704_08305, partial [Anaerolineales bacterium]|nr:hypothetical protein [Anaerolineales bacterium]